MQVDLRRLDTLMAEPQRDHRYIYSALAQEHGAGVPEHVWSHVLRSQRWAAIAGRVGVFGHQRFHCIGAQRTSATVWKEWVGGCSFAFIDPNAQHGHTLGRERRATLFAP